MKKEQQLLEEKRKFPGSWKHIIAQKRKPEDKRNLTVHLIPTTQTYLGFKKTVDEYYSGTNQMSDHISVRSVLTTVTDELDKDPKKKFSFAEVKYIQMWYTRQSQEMKDKFKKVVQNGQFEVVNGGWSSPDEACPSYEDLIDNEMIGHQFMQQEFGVTPQIGWNLMAYGHSATNARLFSDLGYKAQFFAKIDNDVK